MSAIAPAVEQVVRNTHVGARPSAPLTPLPVSSLELAARARNLQYEGRLAEAQPLYERALAKPSSSWRFEADYVRLMNDLGMFEWGAQRAAAILTRLPNSVETACDRAHLMVEQNRSDLSVSRARDVVRTAATCGDPVVIASALSHYSRAMQDLSIPHSFAATERAFKLLGKTDNRWLRCELEVRRQFVQLSTSNDEENWRAIAQRCKDGGNFRYASLALRDAAGAAWHPARAIELLEQAVATAVPVGGSIYDDAMRELADKLRANGKPSEADEKLLGIIGRRLSALIDLCGGKLPAPENQLDADFLKRAGLRPSAGMCTVGQDKQILVRIHKRALQTALRAWADRTRLESVRQASEYQAIADRLDDTKAAPNETPEKAFEAQLAKAKLPLKTIIESQSAPLHASGSNPLEAFEAINGRYWVLRGQRGTETQRAEIVVALKKLAEWTQHPRIQCVALDDEAREKIDAGDPAGALVVARSINTIAPASTYWQHRVVGLEIDIEAKRDPARAVPLRKKRVELARQLSPTDWINAVFNAAYQDWETRQVPTVDRASTARVVKELIDQKAWESAALALEREAKLSDIAQSADGTADAILAYQRRVDVLANLGDPLRTLQARADVVAAIARLNSHQYRANGNRELERFGPAVEVVRAIGEEAQRFVAQGRARDAARLVASVDGAAPGMRKLSTDAIAWTKELQDSAEYHQILGKLYEEQIRQATDRPQRLERASKSRDEYIAAKMPAEAVKMQAAVLRYETMEVERWKQFDRCVDMSNTSGVPGDDCLTDLIALYLDDASIDNPKDKDALRRALAFGQVHLPDWDTRYTLDWRYQLRTYLAMLAGMSGDLTALERWREEVERYYTDVHPDAYRLATHLSRLGFRVGRTNPKLGLKLYQAFDKTPGASAFWRASEYRYPAGFAREAGDTVAERYFYDVGRRYASQFPQYLPWYALDRAYAALAKKDWPTAIRSFAEASTEARSNGAPQWADQIDLFNAMAKVSRRDLGGARAQLASQVRVAKSVASGAPTKAPCYQARVLEVESAIEMAAGNCSEGNLLRAQAEKVRSQCTRDTPLPSMGSDTWTDGPGLSAWRASNSCGKPFTDAENLTR